MKTIAPQTLSLTSEKFILDVRTPAEYESAHIEGAALLPLDKVSSGKVKALAGDREVYVICEGGTRAKKAIEKLAAEGFTNTTLVEGAMKAWIAAGLPVLRGRNVISLERQVRIGAGLLVLTGVVLGFLVHPGFFALSGFVGCGLIFAGITDWCGMGLLLARMPWNQAGGSCCCGSCNTEKV